MAYVEPEKDKEVGADGQPVSTGPESGGGTLGGGGASQGNAAAAAEPAPAGGASGGGPASGPQTQGNFVGIQQYLDANKPQSQKLASNVGGYVSDLGQNVRNTLGTQTGAFNQDVDKNTVGLNQDLFNEAKSNTVGVANDQGKLSEFQKERDASYKGPTDFQNSDYFKPVDASLTKAKQAADNTQTEQGQRNLLNTYEQDKTGKTAGAGVTNFDQALLQGGGGKEALTKARESQGDLTGLIGSAQQAALAKAKQASDTTAATKAAIQNEFGGSGASSQQTLQNQLSQKAQSTINQSKAQQDAITNSLRNGTDLNDSQLNQLGISRNDYKGLREQMQQIQGAKVGQGGGFGLTDSSNIDLSGGQYLTNGDLGSQINAQNVATADDYAKYQALNQLMGTQNNFLNNPSLAGTANTNASKFNLKNAQDYLAGILGGIPKPEQGYQYADPNYSPDSGGNVVQNLAAIPSAVGKAFSGAGKAFSDKRVKKDIKPFKASEFLDSLSKKSC